MADEATRQHLQTPVHRDVLRTIASDDVDLYATGGSWVKLGVEAISLGGVDQRCGNLLQLKVEEKLARTAANVEALSSDPRFCLSGENGRPCGVIQLARNTLGALGFIQMQGVARVCEGATPVYEARKFLIASNQCNANFAVVTFQVHALKAVLTVEGGVV